MFSMNMNSMLKQNQTFLLTRRKHPVVFQHLKRKTQQHAFLFDETMSAVTSKLFANTVCYPFESYRLWVASHIQIQPTPRNLFNGYFTYLPYTVFNNIVTFLLFYSIQNNLQCSTDVSLAICSVLTSLVTSVYKVPFLYMLKRRVMQKEILFSTMMDVKYFTHAYKAIIIEDIPELFIKFYLRDFMNIHFMTLPLFMKSSIIGVLSTIMLFPVELYKTRVICKGVQIHFEPLAVMLRVFISFLNTTVFFMLLEAIKKI
jgi:hypothetical protein